MEMEQQAAVDLVSGTTGLALSALLVLLGTWVILHHFSQREVGWLAFLSALLGFSLSFFIMFFVPYDIFQTLSGGQKVLMPNNWQFVYWVSFVLCWVTYPLLSEYEAAAGFTFAGRLMSLRGIWCGLYALGTFILLICLLIGGVDVLAPWCLSMANVWALLVSSLLMSYGLIAVPRQFWRQASPTFELKRLYCAAVALDEARLSTQYELQDVIAEARVETAQRSAQFWDPSLERAFALLQLTMEECELLHLELTNGAPGRPHQPACGSTPRQLEDVAPRVEYLAQLHGALRQASIEARRAACRWDELINRCLLLEDIEESLLPTILETSTYWTWGPLRWLCQLPCIRTVWHKLVVFWLSILRHRVLRLMALATGALSVVILASQVMLFLDLDQGQLSPVLRSFLETEVIYAVGLGYLVGTTYWSGFRWRVAGWYGLYSNRNTDAGSLLWCATLLSRLVMPLSYHFLLLIRVPLPTSFQVAFNRMDSGTLLPTNKVFVPILLCLVLCHCLNVYSKLLQMLSLENLDFDTVESSPSHEVLSEGRRLVEIARRRRSEDRTLQLELNERAEESGRAIPLRMQIARLIEEGTLPQDWNAVAGSSPDEEGELPP
ncbi:unnamed protein product [Durusdinium trenchii]|uniref:LMBR1 domain-containing protein 2 n=1 Tax=Durusdinium trenchii TaxID=1381693 RepID=A0ABP0IKX0_9DINO